MKRRQFLLSFSAVPALGMAQPRLLAASPDSDVPSERAVLSPSQWRTLAVVQDHLLPSQPESPGAREVRAIHYLDQTLSVPGFDRDVRALILSGVGWLDDLAREHHAAAFHALEPGPREDLLHRIAETGAGERWLSTLIGYTLEALLADPLYGGNPDGVGWTWLGHVPGQPRPTPENLYGRLGRA